MENITIMGFGNPVREDDGVGIYIIEQLQKKIGKRAGLQIFDMGTSAFEILFKLKGQDRIILIDAVLNTGEPVGTLYKVPAEEIESSIEDEPHLYLHSLKWDQALSYAKKILVNDYPKKIDVFLVAIDSTRFDTTMTEAGIKGGDEMTKKILAELNFK